MEKQLSPSGEILLYESGGEKEFVSVVFQGKIFWLTQSGMAELFDCSTDNISLHLKNIYAEEELTPEATTEKISVVHQEGSRQVRRTLEHYNLNAIIAVGYRVNSKKATRFRQWATKTLKEYIQEGFVLNDDEMLKNGRPFGRDYYAELMAEDQVPMSMEDWLRETDRFLTNNRRNVLENRGHISREAAVKKASAIYQEFRKKQDAGYISDFDRFLEKYLKGGGGT